jgi:hypothetical protein
MYYATKWQLMNGLHVSAKMKNSYNFYTNTQIEFRSHYGF